MTHRKLEDTRPPDCTKDVPVDDEDVLVVPTLNGAAMQMFGKPFGDLTRADQRHISTIMRGERLEIEQRIKAIAGCTSLSAHERIARSEPMRDKLAYIMELLAADGVELLTNDNMDVSVVPRQEGGFVKTRSGTIRRNLRHGKVLMSVAKTHAETEVMIAKLYQEKQAAQFVKNDNRQVHVVGPADVEARLGRFGKGEPADVEAERDDPEDSTEH